MHSGNVTQINITPNLSICAKGRDLTLRIYVYEEGERQLWIEGDFYTSYYNHVMGLERSENYSEAVANLKEVQKFLIDNITACYET